MKKHQFVKNNCNCDKRASYYSCIHCAAMEYASPDELMHLDIYRATCPAVGAPLVEPAEKFKASMGGTFDCLSPDFATYFVDGGPENPEIPEDGTAAASGETS